jgi:DNA polymerase III alpha subunit (gram-positive type)
VNNYIFWDTETTGLTKSEAAPIQLQPYITEICMIKTDENFEIVEQYTRLFKVPVKLEDIVKKITGITDEMLENEKPFSYYWKEIAEFFFGCKTMVAHNVNYDRDCLKYELIRLGKLMNFPWPINHECTVEKSMHIKGYRLKLGDLHEHLFCQKFEGAHRAEEDVKAVIKCYKELKARENG